jgi:hypothetical protein
MLYYITNPHSVEEEYCVPTQDYLIFQNIFNLEYFM